MSCLVCVALYQDNCQCTTMHMQMAVFHMQIRGFIVGGQLVLRQAKRFELNNFIRKTFL